jgi:hypothetical protein
LLGAGGVAVRVRAGAGVSSEDCEDCDCDGPPTGEVGDILRLSSDERRSGCGESEPGE